MARRHKSSNHWVWTLGVCAVGAASVFIWQQQRQAEPQAGPDSSLLAVAMQVPRMGAAATQPLVFDSPVFKQAKGLMAEVKLVEARASLSEMMVDPQAPVEQKDRAMEMISEINAKLFFSAQIMDGDPLALRHTVQAGQRLGTIAKSHNVPWELVARINGITDPAKLQADRRLKVVEGPFHAIVSRSRFTLDVYAQVADKKIFVRRFPVGLGKDRSTPTGTWKADPEKKLRNPTWNNPRSNETIAGTDPKNPLGGFWVGLIGTEVNAVGALSYGIHGTNEPDSIGKEESMGCVRLRNEDMAVLYDMLTPGKSMVTTVD